MHTIKIKIVSIVVVAFLIFFSLPSLVFAQDSGVEEFVTRFYNLCLDRQPDQAGLENWVSYLESGRLSGADVARRFIFSEEFQAKNTSNKQFLQVMYRAFFNRPPDPGGYAGWLGQLQRGRSRSFVLDGFVGSVEFARLCEKYGIQPGTGGYAAAGETEEPQLNIWGSDSFSFTLGQVVELLKGGHPQAYNQLSLVSRIVERDLSGYSASAMADIDRMVIYIDLGSFESFGPDRLSIITATLSHELNHMANRDLADSMSIADFEKLALSQELETCYGIGARSWYIDYIRRAIDSIYDSSTWWWNENDVAA